MLNIALESFLKHLLVFYIFIIHTVVGEYFLPTSEPVVVVLDFDKIALYINNLLQFSKL